MRRPLLDTITGAIVKLVMTLALMFGGFAFCWASQTNYPVHFPGETILRIILFLIFILLCTSAMIMIWLTEGKL